MGVKGIGGNIVGQVWSSGGLEVVGRAYTLYGGSLIVFVWSLLSIDDRIGNI